MPLPSGSLAGLFECLQKNPAVCLIRKNSFLTVSPAYHMINGSFKLNGRTPSHPPFFRSGESTVNEKD